MSTLPSYVVDANSLYWYLQFPLALSPAADAVFRLAESGGTLILVPTISVAEIHYLSRKRAAHLSFQRLIGDLSKYPFARLLPLDIETLLTMDTIDDVPEMHDRIIAAHAKSSKAPLVTKDGVLRRSRHIETIW